jgi:hypothetical protein
VKTRYRYLSKSRACLFMLFALGNLLVVRNEANRKRESRLKNTAMSSPRARRWPELAVGDFVRPIGCRFDEAGTVHNAILALGISLSTMFTRELIVRRGCKDTEM